MVRWRAVCARRPRCPLALCAVAFRCSIPARSTVRTRRCSSGVAKNKYGRCRGMPLWRVAVRSMLKRRRAPCCRHQNWRRAAWMAAAAWASRMHWRRRTPSRLSLAPRYCVCSCAAYGIILRSARRGGSACAWAAQACAPATCRQRARGVAALFQDVAGGAFSKHCRRGRHLGGRRAWRGLRHPLLHIGFGNGRHGRDGAHRRRRAGDARVALALCTCFQRLCSRCAARCAFAAFRCVCVAGGRHHCAISRRRMTAKGVACVCALRAVRHWDCASAHLRKTANLSWGSGWRHAFYAHARTGKSVSNARAAARRRCAGG